MTSEDVLYCSDFITLRTNNEYELTTEFIGEGTPDANGKDVVVAVALFDKNKSLLQLPIPELFFSDKYGTFLYAEAATNGVKKTTSKTLAFPEQAAYVILRVFKWKFDGHVACESPPRLAIKKANVPLFKPSHTFLGKTIYYESEFIDIAASSFHLFTYILPEGKLGGKGKDLLAVFRFFDGNGQALSESGEGLTLSPSYGPYLYINLQSQPVQVSNTPFTPPAGAVTLKVIVLAWEYTGSVQVTSPARLMQQIGSGSLEAAPGQNFVFQRHDWGAEECFAAMTVMGSGQSLAPVSPFEPHSLFPSPVAQFCRASARDAYDAIHFTVPEKATHFDYVLYCSNQNMDTKSISIDLEREKNVYPQQAQWVDMPVEYFFSYMLQATFYCDAEDHDYTPVFGLSFIQQDGTISFSMESVVKNGEPYTKNASTLSQFVEITPESTGSNIYEATVSIFPPPNTRLLRLGIFNAGQHNLRYDINLSVQDFCQIPSEQTFSAEVSVADISTFLSRKVWENYFQFRIRAAVEESDGAHLAHLFRYCIINGLVAMGSIAARAIVTSPHQHWKIYGNAKHLLGENTELSPGWVPEIPGPDPVPRTNAARPVRVAHFFKTVMPYEYTGGSIRCANIVSYQKKAGLDPLVVTPLGYRGPSENGNIYDVMEYDGILNYHTVPMSFEEACAMPPDKALTVDSILTYELLKDKDVDLIQASSGYRGYDSALKGLSVARKLGVPFVYEVRSFHEHTWTSQEAVLEKEKTLLRIAKENFCMQAADAVVTICETMKQELVKRGVDGSKIFLVPNSVNVEHFLPNQDVSELKSQLGLADKKVLGYISNLSKREGHSVLLRAFARVKHEHPDLVCIFVGEGPDLDNLQNLSRSLQLDDIVFFIGKVPHENIAQYYAMIDLFIVPRIEDYAGDFVTPMKPLEAMAMKRPIIVSDRPALKELVNDGERGLIFESGNEEQLGELITYALANPAELAAKVENAYLWILTQRTWEKNILVYKDLYAELLRNRGRAS